VNLISLILRAYVDELTVVEELVIEVLLDLMTERVMLERGFSIGLQESLTRGLPTYPSTSRAGPSRPIDKK
jgi:hypothetical protein